MLKADGGGGLRNQTSAAPAGAFFCVREGEKEIYESGSSFKSFLPLSREDEGGTERDAYRDEAFAVATVLVGRTRRTWSWPLRTNGRRWPSRALRNGGGTKLQVPKMRASSFSYPSKRRLFPEPWRAAVAAAV
jgi:hypothetical protein